MIENKSFDGIKNKSLLDFRSFINGEWKDSPDKTEVFNPFNQKLIATTSVHGSKDTKLAIEAAHSSLNEWKKILPQERSDLLRSWFDLINQNIDDIARIMTIEQGKPLADSITEIKYGASFVEWFAEESKRIHGEVYPTNKLSNKYIGINEPIGVVGAITPWNFPMAMITRKICPAIAAGCTIVLKPSEETPLTAIALVKLAEQAGFPKGVINLVLGDSKEIGLELTNNNKVRKLSFTGSTAVGKILYKQSADTLKKLSLELGGNAPFIVFDDANLKLAVAGLAAAKSRNTGQACTSVNRVYVSEKIFDKFVALLLPEFKKLKIGNGLDKNINQGPLINKKAADKVTKLVADAISNGSKIIHQDKNDLGGSFFPPTLIEVTKQNLDIEKEEIFGPVIALYKFNCSDEEIVERANNTNYGLASYFYSESKNRIWNISSKLEYGMVGVNESMISNAYIPFGGVKHSGFGREGSIHGIHEYLQIKYIALGDSE
ncbi:MAG: NAD-dependent succinate-semialdehyde dehydrogenase [Rickettsiales bacterium]